MLTNSLIDNKSHFLYQELQQVMVPEAKVYLALPYTTIPALHLLLPQLRKAAQVQLLIGTTPQGEVTAETAYTYCEQEAPHYHNLQAQQEAREVLQLIREKVACRMGNAAQFAMIVETPEMVHYYMPLFEGLQLLSLGKLPQPAERSITAMHGPQAMMGSWLQMFHQNWAQAKPAQDFLLTALQRAARDYSPEEVYRFALYHSFRHLLDKEDRGEQLQRIGLTDTKVWNMLFNFQKDAVLGAIDKIETLNGCIIADSVGLGKTFEALAVIKYYELRNGRVLVLCPKKLRENWVLYARNDERNVLHEDHFFFDVLNHTDLTRGQGMTGDIDLSRIQWGNYDLVVIDESHNFRNNPANRGHESRYQRLMNQVILKGIKTKVLMLSATPVNTRLADIKNQLAFITANNDAALQAYGVVSIDKTLREAQRQFNQWVNSNKDVQGDLQCNSRDALVQTLDHAYFKLLDLFTIARSRKHIQKYYDTADIGNFPKRLRPISRQAGFDLQGNFPDITRMNDQLNALSLGFYAPLTYVRPDRQAFYAQQYDIQTAKGTHFSQADREESLVHLMRVNLLKRLESSVHAFGLTLEALLRRIDLLLGQLDKFNEQEFEPEVDIESFDPDDEALSELLIGGKVKVLLQDIDRIKFRQELEDDYGRLQQLLHQARLVDTERDAKLAELKALIAQKVREPLNPENRKVIVFSAFADTAKYLYQALSTWARQEFGLHSALVTGANENKTTLPGVRPDLHELLTHFSPISKKRASAPEAEQIDLLFCTDCISEGQNLQDCDYLVNYDIHWNPVRIIQRFGRIDRIGSKNEQIQLVNFYPNVDLDLYINLIERVKGRMKMLDISATGDENIIDETAAQHKELEYRKRQLKQLQHAVLDFEDLEGGISITDLTFSDYKAELQQIPAPELQAMETWPKAIYALAPAQEGIAKGAIFCLKERQPQERAVSPLAPYALCYLNEEGELQVPVVDAKRSLDYFGKVCAGHAEVLPQLLAGFGKSNRMEPYRSLLLQARNTLGTAQEERGLLSLFSPGGTQQLGAASDLEIIAYVLIR